MRKVREGPRRRKSGRKRSRIGRALLVTSHPKSRRKAISTKMVEERLSSLGVHQRKQFVETVSRRHRRGKGEVGIAREKKWNQFLLVGCICLLTY